MRFASTVFRLAGVLGFISLLPLYWLEERISLDTPPAITHPEFFYGFIGVTIAWQAAFWLIGSDPVRFRPLMLAAVLEKASFVMTMFILWLRGRVPSLSLSIAFPDLLWGVLFLIAYFRLRDNRYSA